MMPGVSSAHIKSFRLPLMPQRAPSRLVADQSPTGRRLVANHMVRSYLVMSGLVFFVLGIVQDACKYMVRSTLLQHPLQAARREEIGGMTTFPGNMHISVGFSLFNV